VKAEQLWNEQYMLRPAYSDDDDDDDAEYDTG